MRENGFVIDKAFTNGLAPDLRVPPHAPYLLTCKNAVPESFAAVIPDLPVDPLSNTVTSFPFPQYCYGEKVMLLADATTLYTVAHTSATWTKSAITTYDASNAATEKAITTGGVWHHASFQSNWFLTNGSTLAFKIPSATSEKALATTALTVQSVCAFRDRLVLGGLAGTWFAGNRWLALFQHWKDHAPEGRYVNEDMAFDTSWVIWGQPGGGDKEIPFHVLMSMLGVFGTTDYDKFHVAMLDAIEKGTIGMCPLRNPGAIQSLQPAPDNVVAYGRDGVSVLAPVGKSFDETGMLPVSAAGRGASSGTVFFDTQGGLWQDFKQLGWIDSLKTLAATGSVVISHDTERGYYWISNGTTCYVLTPRGLGGPMTVHPTGLFRHWNKQLVGAASGISSTYEVEFETVPVNLAQNGTKHMTTLQVDCDGLTRLQGRIVGRGNGSAWITTPWLFGNQNNVVFLCGSYRDAKIGLKATVAAASATTFRLSRIESRNQGEDRRHVRGGTSTREGQQE